MQSQTPQIQQKLPFSTPKDYLCLPQFGQPREQEQHARRDEQLPTCNIPKSIQ